jgi:hypothetical protein
MVQEKYPLAQFRHIVERIDQGSLLHRTRRWIGNDDTDWNYLITLPPGDDPLYVELSWKHAADAHPEFVGIFKFFIAALLSEGYVRQLGGGNVRLRIVHCPDGVLYIQTKSGKPALAIGELRAAQR